MALSRSSSAAVVLASIVVLLLISVDFTSAKRGCTAFGHSCFGGHGKRSEADNPMVVFPGDQNSIEDATVQRALQEGAFPIRAHQGGAMQPPLALSPLLRQWLQSYRQAAGDMETK